MIFLDTSAIYALASASDSNHGAARSRFAAILAEGEPIVTHNYVLVESLALLQHRLGLKHALAFERESRRFSVQWITPEIHADALERWAAGRRGISFVDQVSFLVMERLRIRRAFAFDDDFEAAGFELAG